MEAYDFERGTAGTACRGECENTSGFGPKQFFSSFLRWALKISCSPHRNHSEAPRATQNDIGLFVIKVG